MQLLALGPKSVKDVVARVGGGEDEVARVLKVVSGWKDKLTLGCGARWVNLLAPSAAVRQDQGGCVASVYSSRAAAGQEARCGRIRQDGPSPERRRAHGV